MNSSGDAIPGASPRRPSAAPDAPTGTPGRAPGRHRRDGRRAPRSRRLPGPAVRRSRVDSEDLAQVARLALVRAAHRFDPLPGASFSTYATPCILGELRRCFRDVGGPVRPPRHLQELSAQQGRAEADLSLDLGRTPTPTEVAEGLGVTRETLGEARRTAGWSHGVSPDALITDDHSALAGRRPSSTSTGSSGTATTFSPSTTAPAWPPRWPS
jgi:hypothetical protein